MPPLRDAGRRQRQAADVSETEAETEDEDGDGDEDGGGEMLAPAVDMLKRQSGVALETTETTRAVALRSLACPYPRPCPCPCQPQQQQGVEKAQGERVEAQGALRKTSSFPRQRRQRGQD